MITAKDLIRARRLGGGGGSSGGSSGGDEKSQLDALIDGSITEVVSNVETIRKYAFYKYQDVLTTVKFPSAKEVRESAFEYCNTLSTAQIPLVRTLRSNAFRGCVSLSEVDFPNVETVEDYAFQDCKKMVAAKFKNATTLRQNAFQACAALSTIEFPKVTTFNGSYQFRNCTSLRVVDFPLLSTVTYSSFDGCSALLALVLRSEMLVTLANTSAFTGTLIASGTGYIYVPAALVDTYKAATNWSTYAAQFRALEDYTVDGTITGELDESKI